MKKNVIVTFLVSMILLLAVAPVNAQTRRGSRARRSTTVKKATRAKMPTTVAKPKLVDLGLPSGNLWADRNVGATSLTSYGGYYAFGETKTKGTYMDNNYTMPNVEDIAGTQYDVATVKYGKGWQVPSEADWQELFDNCKHNSEYVNNVMVFKFTGPNGNSIILPFRKDFLLFITKDAATTKRLLPQIDLYRQRQAKIKLAREKYGIDFDKNIQFLRISNGKFAIISGAVSKSSNPELNNNHEGDEFSIEQNDNQALKFTGFPVRAVFHPQRQEDTNQSVEDEEGIINLDGQQKQDDSNNTNTSTTITSDDKIYEKVDVEPSFPGGTENFMKYLSNNVEYPVVAQNNGVQGRVIVSAVVEKDGSLSNIRIARSVDPSLDREAMRVVKAMPKIIPGKLNGVNVRSVINIPLTFYLE